jgi:uncharacterized protein GlcG (DUF336 family)
MLTLAKAQLIVEKSLAKGRELSLAPLAVAVVDAGGHLVAFAREDGAGIVRFDVAYAKAWGSLGMGFGSRELTERAAKAPTFINVLATVSGGRMAPSPGGVIITNAHRHVIGAVGISGDTGDNDEIAALAGIAAADFLGFGGTVG